jgi:CBS domain containing-hemolysin-like protein
MKNRTSSSVSGNSSSTSSSLHGGLSCTMSSNHIASATIGSTATTTNMASVATNFRTTDDYNDNNNIESQRLLNESNDTVDPNNPRTSYTVPISILFLSSILLFYVGWYGPRNLMNRNIDDIIARNTPPFRIITTDSKKQIILLDPTYNHPVVDPPTISCT